MPRTVWLRALAVCAALVLPSVAGCTAATPGTRVERAAAQRTEEGTTVPQRHGSARPKADVPDCFRGTGATAHRVPVGGSDTRMVTLGDGPRGIAFAPISWGDACEWSGEARRLAAGGYRVVTFDWGSGREETVAAATTLLRDEGAEAVTWVGGCMGGTVMLGMAAHANDRPAGVAGISPLASLGGVGVDGGADYGGELLLLGTARDPLADESRLREVAARFPQAEVTVLPGVLHAAEIFGGAHREHARRSLDGFLGRAFARNS
ncbi:alpha/beta fold hydrolase [Streptomyces afghaniensis]|uniref:alpha/beta fold hydrolase n=1 Tax=Streptomyces afghaniensis TaxID=66865 RepID=UPI00277F49EF|nr:alpha/beta hydrolase [Streptomyces afghaniensis]MDQ1019008.1 pimeloyl-ACP methyl ester carboxylesterase [Streptomyces afghaniensis]